MKKTAIALTIWLTSIFLLVLLRSYFKATAPVLYLEWEKPTVRIEGKVKPVTVELIGDKLLILLDNGDIITIHIPKTQLLSRGYDITTCVLVADCLIGWIIVLLLSDID